LECQLEAGQVSSRNHQDATKSHSSELKGSLDKENSLILEMSQQFDTQLLKLQVCICKLSEASVNENILLDP
jgi:hypothetical protein